MKIFYFFIGTMLFTCFAFSEPYLAVRESMDCSSCHVNPSGGGLRNSFGNIYSQNSLSASQLPSSNKNRKLWTGEVLDYFNVGGNARYSSRMFDIDGQDDSTNLGTDRTSLYLNINVNEYISLLIDQQVAPGGSINRESWIKLNYDSWYFRVGKIFQPFGWRIEDDTAFIRESTGINFNSADNGVELGFSNNDWSMQFSIVNGTAGAIEVDDGKQGSLRIARIFKDFQLGMSANKNATDLGDREMLGIFVGLNTGPVSWLFEWDQIEDSDFVALNEEQDLFFLEANYEITKGHNLKITYESLSFDSVRKDRDRYSAVWEYFPIPYTQFRLGARQRDSDDANPVLNSEEIFAQLHVYF